MLYAGNQKPVTSNQQQAPCLTDLYLIFTIS